MKMEWRSEMEGYKKVLLEEVEEFRKAGHKFLKGEINKGDFKKISGGMGSYAQRDGKTFMIRLRTPSGLLSLPHLTFILSYVRKYKLERIHLTTRQAIQLHDLEIDDVCDIMKDAIAHDLFTRGGGGNYPRNVALSPMAGVERGEAFDVTPYALLVGDYFLKNATGYHLPRKVKVAFSSGQKDTAGAGINDLGFMADLEKGIPVFRMWIAGGMGQGAALGIPYEKAIDPRDVLYYVEALIRLFVNEGDYENRSKARIRFIPKRMGDKEFLQCYEKYVEEVKDSCKLEEIAPVLADNVKWEEEKHSHILFPQRQKGTYTLLLHPLCGQLGVDEASKIYDFLKEENKEEIRLGLSEDMYIRNLSLERAKELWEIMKDKMMDTKIGQSVSCIGTPTCQIGVQQSQQLCKNIIHQIEEGKKEEGRLPSLSISGCPNSCARHQVSSLGFAGKMKKVEGTMMNVFDMYAGGKVQGSKSKMGQCYGTLPADKIPEFIQRLLEELEKEEMSFETFLEEKEEKFLNLTKEYRV